MCFTKEPIPEILSERTLAQYGSNAPFRHREVIRGWVEDIFVRGGTLELIEFNTTVERAEKKRHEWILTLRKETPGSKKNYWWQEVFDALVVATGHFSLPYVPSIPGLAEYDEKYPGSIKHSKHFRSVDEFRGKVRACAPFLILTPPFCSFVSMHTMLEAGILYLTYQFPESHHSGRICLSIRCTTRNSISGTASRDILPEGAYTSFWLECLHTPTCCHQAANCQVPSGRTNRLL